MFKQAKSLLATSLSVAMLATLITIPASATTTTQLEGQDRYKTALKIVQNGWTTSENVVIARGDVMADALVAAPLAYQKDKAPILLTETDKIPAGVLEKLADLGVENVYIVGGTSAVSTTVENKLKDDYAVTRIEGKDRFETSYEIAKEAFTTMPTEAVIANGMTLVDALSVSSIAAAKGMPILLVKNDVMSADVASYIADKEVYAVGGPTVINAEILGEAERLSGLDRYKTNAAILDTFAQDYSNIYVAMGTERHLVDSLSGSALAALHNNPMVLVNDKSEINADQETVLAKNITSDSTVVGLGGSVEASAVTAIKAVTPEKLDVKSVSAINGTTLSVIFEGKDAVEITVPALVGGQTVVTFTYEAKEYTGTLATAYVTPVIGGGGGGHHDSTPATDLTAYNAAIAAKVETDYTSDSWTTYQAVVTANVETTANTQAEVDAAISAITTAQGDLVEVAVPTLITSVEKPVWNAETPNAANMNTFMNGLWTADVNETEALGFDVNNIFAWDSNKLTIDASKITVQMKTFINTNYGGTSVPVKLMFDGDITIDMAADANWSGAYLDWINLAEQTINGEVTRTVGTSASYDVVTTIVAPAVTLSQATATGNFDNTPNINEMMTALWTSAPSTVQGIDIKPVFSIADDGALTVDGDNVSAGLLQWILTQWGGSSVPVAMSFSNGTPEGMTADANWDNGYTVWVDLGALVVGTVPVVVPMTNRTTPSYSITTITAMAINATVPEFTVGVPATFTVGAIANSDKGKMVQAHFTIPAGVTVEYQEGGAGAWIPLVDVFGPTSGFPLGDITTTLNGTFTEAGTYTVTVEYIEVETKTVLGSIDITATATAIAQ